MLLEDFFLQGSFNNETFRNSFNKEINHTKLKYEDRFVYNELLEYFEEFPNGLSVTKPSNTLECLQHENRGLRRCSRHFSPSNPFNLSKGLPQNYLKGGNYSRGMQIVHAPPLRSSFAN